jgi:prepilin-type N-terminal cleavage/methylation domain-containing protein
MDYSLEGKLMKTQKGFSLLEVIVAVGIMAILAAAIAPVMFNKLDEARYQKVAGDLQAIYEGSMGIPSEDYFGFVGDMGRLPDSTAELISGTGLGSQWSGPYVSMGGSMTLRDVFGSDYVFDQSPIRVRSFGPNKVDDSGSGDDLVYPENALTSFEGQLEAQVYINGSLITDDAAENVTANLSYSDNGTLQSPGLALSFDGNIFAFEADSIHQGSHVLTVVASKSVLGGQDPTTTQKEQVIILPGATTKIDVAFSDADYMTRLDTDLDGNGVPDRLEDTDGDGVPDSMDNDIDGDGVPNAIDSDPYDPTVGDGGGGGGVAPIVNSVTPSYGHQGDTNLTLTIDGAYFQDSATVTFSLTGITVLTVPATFNSSSQLVVNVNIGASASTETRDVTVDNPGGLGGTGVNKFDVLEVGMDPAPIINQVIPDSAQQGVTGRPISIQGQNFQEGAIVYFTNTGISIVPGSGQYINSNELQCSIDVSGGASVGTDIVRVTNPDEQLAEKPFKVVAVIPNISQINPNNGDEKENNFRIDITGSNFLSGIQVSADDMTIDWVTWVSSSLVEIQVDLGASWFGIDTQIILTNPGGGSDQATFHINGRWE